MAIRPSRRTDKFTWGPDDVTWLTPLEPEKDAVLWLLKGAGNRQEYDDAMISAAFFLQVHPNDQEVDAAITAAGQRLGIPIDT